MNTNTTAMKTVQDLIAHVVAECSTIDREARFDQMLDECYSFAEVGGPFASMSPSEVLKECDPVAYRCGVNDLEDSEGWIEINGDYYDSDEVEKAREEFLDEMRSELSDMEIEQCDHESEDAEERDTDRLSSLMTDIPALESRIEELEHYTF